LEFALRICFGFRFSDFVLLPALKVCLTRQVKSSRSDRFRQFHQSAVSPAGLPNGEKDACGSLPSARAIELTTVATKMDFRRSGQLDERRRRVLMDELAQPADSENGESAPTGSGSAKGPVRAYGPAVLDQLQPRITDLLPVRPLWTAAAILLALTAVAAIECIHIHARTLPASASQPAGGSQVSLAALDVAHTGGLDDWFASLLLAGGAALAMTTYGIRRHRVDDYRGRYRVWLWTAGALAWGSLDAATQVHSAVGAGIAAVAGQTLLTGPAAAAITISWLAIYGLLFGTLAIRLAIEVRQSFPALSAVGLAVLGYLLCGMATLDMLPTHGPLVDSTLRTTLVLLSHVAIVSAVGLFARHVYLDAAGRLKVHIDPDKNRRGGKAKPKARLKVVAKDDSQIKKPQPEKTEAKSAAAESKSAPAAAAPRFSIGNSAPQPSRAGAGISKATATSPSYDDEDDDEDEDGDERLSRAERRRLKKLARRDGQRRAA
jgi:hypothetical protein